MDPFDGAYLISASLSLLLKMAEYSVQLQRQGRRKRQRAKRILIIVTSDSYCMAKRSEWVFWDLDTSRHERGREIPAGVLPSANILRNTIGKFDLRSKLKRLFCM